jgi:4-amino-4-deoxy-L-arabinose transferase-like glycosyltransferase
MNSRGEGLNAAPAAPVAPARRTEPLLAGLILAATALFIAAVRIRLLEVPLDRDEGEYAYVGQQLLQGVPPFASIYHVKLPGIYAVYAATLGLFGETVAGVRIGLLVVNLASSAVLFAIARRFFAPLASALSAASFALLTLGQELDGFSANAEHFVLLPALLGLLALLAAPGARRERGLVFLAGLGLGIATLIKQQGLFFVLAGAAYGLAFAWTERPRRLARRLWDGGAYAVGATLPFLALCAGFAALGLFGRFWWWTVYYPQRYISEISWADGWGNFWLSFHPAGEELGVTGAYAPLLAFAALGGIWLVGSGRRRALAFLASLGLFSALAVAAGLHFFPHYYLLATPAVALAVGAGAEALRVWRGPALALVVVVALLGFAIERQRAYLFTRDPILVSRTSFAANPFPESVEIARYLEAHTEPGDRIAVLGSEPQLYFLSKRRAATGYVYTYEMMREHPHVRELQTEMIEEIESAEPRYVVMVNILASWQPARLENPDRFLLDWAGRFLREHYRRVGVVEILWPRRALGAFCWVSPERTCPRPPRVGGQAPLWIGIHERLPDAGAVSLSPPASGP